ncbi:Ribonuclease 1 [Dichanthelium oligosanthes]|uniref:Ribonuclease 1 n=1 Tax=Dichanthelium oligosanthes TaxID=888268 RepID=A0A1E5UWD3_9POAL|nr:Ribonuclease 1 [Dichanthelium oligosanthes]
MTKLLLSAALALLPPLLAASSSSEDFDYYYLVQQWPGAYCGTKQGCCFPDTGKPAEDFGIHGLWPQYTVCRRDASDAAAADFDIVSATRKRDWPSLSCKNTAMDFWSHEWEKHGTCSGFDQHGYFQQSLARKARHNLTAILPCAGIVPSDGATYHLSSVRDAIREATGFEVTVECNRGASGRRVGQLYQVYLCVARDWSVLINCPEPVNRQCTDKIKFPAF